MKKLGLYELSVIIFFLLFPLIAALMEMLFIHNEFSAALLFKWFTFSMVGLRLFSCAVKQIFCPSFTATSIFGISDAKVLPAIREIGFANLSFGIVGILSLFLPNFRIPAAVCGGLYFLFAALGHIFTEKRKQTELFPLFTDLFAFAVLAVLLVFNII